jgi:hypothetical protein
MRMDTNTPLVPGRSKREMKYHRFAIEPGDTELLDQLKAEHREVLFSRGTYQERAQALNIPVGTVRSRLHRARAALEALRNGRPVIDERITQLN